MARVEDLFNGLDLRSVRSGDASWRVEVFAIREDGDRVWIQLGLTSDAGESLSLVVRAATTADAPTILSRVEEWVERRDRDAIRTLEID